jgi:hypothetical protein
VAVGLVLLAVSSGLLTGRAELFAEHAGGQGDAWDNETELEVELKWSTQTQSSAPPAPGSGSEAVDWTAQGQ